MRVRFAPSPTNCAGFETAEEMRKSPNYEQIKDSASVHAGGLRTLLLNYALAKKEGGELILRIEDTDEKRSNDDCLNSMLRDFFWADITFSYGACRLENGKYKVSLDPNGQPSRQSERKQHYKFYADTLIKKGFAEVRNGAIYFKMPKEKVTFYDGINGFLSLPADQCEDFVIIKSTEMPSFYMAMTVDDHTMGITDVVRGKEHINSTFRQVALCKALGFNEPNFYHLPLIMNPDGSKMSKRQDNGKVNVYDFVKAGYLKEALINYLLTLGWSPEKYLKKRFFTIAEFISAFRLDHISKNSPKFNYDHLDDYNKHYIKEMTVENFKNRILDFGKTFYPEKYKKMEGHYDSFVEAYKDKIKTLSEAWENCDWIFDNPEFKDSDIAFAKANYSNSDKVLAECVKLLSDDSQIDDVISGVQKTGHKNKDIIWPIRFAITGAKISPTLQSAVKIIGVRAAKKRIESFARRIRNVSH